MPKESAKAALVETADYAAGAAPSAPYEEEAAAEYDLERNEAEIEGSGAGVVFSVAGGGSVSGDNEARITWSFSLKPGEKRELPLACLIEYPSDHRIEGI